MRTHIVFRSYLLLFALIAWPVQLAQCASPRLSIITPRGVQRGAEHVLTFTGNQLADVEEIFFYNAGFTVNKLEPDKKNVKVTVEVAADCRLGEHIAQVRTKSGISDFRSVWVEALPAVAEAEPNSDFETPQAIDLNVVVGGTIANEDVDYFVVDAKKDQRISAEVVAMRLGSAMFDPYVAILDTKRFELSANDDTAFALQDGFASCIVPEDGKYIIEVRESSYAGGSHYRLHVGTFPRPTIVYPAGGKLGEQVEVQLLGMPGSKLTHKVTLPSAKPFEFGVISSDDGGMSPTPNVFRTYEHGNAFEVEPNNGFDQATSVDLPLAFNGIIQEEGDVDFFTFDAKKDVTYHIECYARRVRSPLDPVINLYGEKNKHLAGNDDSRGPDSYLRWKAPADSKYMLRVRDHLDAGGPEYVYRVECSPVQPRVTLGIPRLERYGQALQQICVPRGNRFGTVVTVARSDAGGDLVLTALELPEGITMHSEPVPPGANKVPVVFEASAGAPVAGRLIDFYVRETDSDERLPGGFRNKADFVNSAPNQTVYRAKEVDKFPVAVTEEVPFRIEIAQPKVPVVRNGSMQLKVVAHRDEGFDGDIRVRFPFRPPGVGAQHQVVIKKGQNEVFYPLNANGKAAIKKWRVFATGHANVKGNVWIASQLATLEVAEPHATFAMQRTACEQGQDTQVVCKINHVSPFEGIARARLLGLPPKTTTEEFIEFNKETAELVFNVNTALDSPVGKHKGLFCQVTVTQHGEPIVNRAGGTELQIDAPPPAPATPQPEQTAVKSEPDKPKAKPLSRLEKLRIAAKQRVENQADGN